MEDEVYVDNVRRKKKKPVHGRALVVAVIVFLAVFLTLSSMYSLEQNRYGYVTRFSKMVTIESQAGLHFKAPLIDSVREIPACQMVYDIPASDVLTRDKKALVIDEFCIWRITDPYQYVRSLNASKAEAEARIEAAVYSAVKNEFGRLDREEIISTDQTSVRQVSERVTQQVDAALGSYGISCTVILKKTDLPTENQSAVFERMIAERQLQSTSYLSNGELEGNRIRNDVDKQVEIIIAEAQAAAEKRGGEAEAEYMRILSEAYSSTDKAEFYRFVREIDAMKAAYASGGGATLILDGDSEIARAILGN